MATLKRYDAGAGREIDVPAGKCKTCERLIYKDPDTKRWMHNSPENHAAKNALKK